MCVPTNRFVRVLCVRDSRKTRLSRLSAGLSDNAHIYVLFAFVYVFSCLKECEIYTVARESVVLLLLSHAGEAYVRINLLSFGRSVLIINALKC